MIFSESYTVRCVDILTRPFGKWSGLHIFLIYGNCQIILYIFLQINAESFGSIENDVIIIASGNCILPYWNKRGNVLVRILGTLSLDQFLDWVSGLEVGLYIVDSPNGESSVQCMTRPLVAVRHIVTSKTLQNVSSSCSRGDGCPFRHEPAALTNETVTTTSTSTTSP